MQDVVGRDRDAIAYGAAEAPARERRRDRGRVPPGGRGERLEPALALVPREPQARVELGRARVARVDLEVEGLSRTPSTPAATSGTGVSIACSRSCASSRRRTASRSLSPAVRMAKVSMAHPCQRDRAVSSRGGCVGARAGFGDSMYPLPWPARRTVATPPSPCQAPRPVMCAGAFAGAGCDRRHGARRSRDRGVSPKKGESRRRLEGGSACDAGSMPI
jgi:hypothetical protein